MAPSAGLPEQVATEKELAVGTNPSKLKSRPSRRFAFILLIVGVVAVAAIVGGAVGGTQAAKKSKQ